MTIAMILGLNAVALTSANADHNIPDITVGDIGECGAVEFSTAWTTNTHTVANTVLVVQAGGAQQTAAIGEAIEVGATEEETATIRYRVWGGGERAYDVPALDDLDALLAHIDAGGDPLDADAPGVAWQALEIEGCPVVPDPDPCEWDAELLATDDECVEPVDEDPVDDDPTDVGTQDGTSNDDAAPVAVPTSVPAGEQLPKTGVNPVLAGLVGAGLLGAGGALLALRRRRMNSF